MFFCDNHLHVINKLPKVISNDIEQLEQDIHYVKNASELEPVREKLKGIVKSICALRKSDGDTLKFIGGLTLIAENMKFDDSMKYNVKYGDIDDNNLLR